MNTVRQKTIVNTVIRFVDFDRKKNSQVVVPEVSNAPYPAAIKDNVKKSLINEGRENLLQKRYLANIKIIRPPKGGIDSYVVLDITGEVSTTDHLDRT